MAPPPWPSGFAKNDRDAQKEKDLNKSGLLKVVPVTRVELVTFGLQNRCSTN
jgi:hypothetical protein